VKPKVDKDKDKFERKYLAKAVWRHENLLFFDPSKNFYKWYKMDSIAS
jgi:hypothetical protein